MATTPTQAPPTQNANKPSSGFKPFSRIIPTKTTDYEFKFVNFYLDSAQADIDYTFSLLRSSAEGIDPEEVKVRATHHGPNEISREKDAKWYVELTKKFWNPFILLLIVLAGISFATDDIAGGTVVSIMVFVSVLLTFFQEFRSSKAAQKLRAMVTTTATVTRKTAFINISQERAQWLTKKKEVAIGGLVPGDVVHLSAGDMIPADLRLITSKDLFISQSSMTGEALPVEKQAGPQPTTIKGLLEQKNLCFMGSTVISGTATAIILKTGRDTYLGSISKNLEGQRIQTSFDKGINRFTWLMIKFMCVMVPMVFVINWFAKGSPLEAFMFAIAVAVGLTPEMLPMIVTVNLAKGALAMSKKKVIVKRLNSIQNFGAMDTLCTDKTGTLTQDKVILEKYVDPEGNPSEQVLKYAYLNSFYQTGLKNLLDRAVLDHRDLNATLNIFADYKKIDEIPFDFSRRRMSVVVEEQRKRHVLICKGALEEIVEVSSRAEVDGEIRPFDDEFRRVISEVARLMNEDGLRVIAVAYKELPNSQTDYTVRDESELTLLGFMAFLDPPKETAKKAIEGLHALGIRVKVLTGDSEIVTRKVCKEVGLSVDRILHGHEIDALTEAQLADLTDTINVFVKLTPVQKQKLVQAMHTKGHVVGFMGDGINDSPALRAADVGISVDNAVDIAKESADIILLEKNLLVLEEGVIEGRKVFGNIVKYIKMGASSNFGNMFSVLGASIMLPFLPMMPVQLLVQNLLYDLSQTAIPLDSVDKEYLLAPRKWEIGDIGRFMVCIGPISSIFDYATFALMWWLFKAKTLENQALFQSGWFVEGLLSQTLIVHMIRTRSIPFIQSRATWPLIFTTALVMAVGIYIPFSWLGAKIGLVPLPGAYFPWLVLMLLSYAFLTQWVKTLYIRKYGYN